MSKVPASLRKNRNAPTAWGRISPMQRKFVKILFELPGIPRIQALIKAGYKGSDVAAIRQASRWSHNPEVMAAIKEYAEKEYHGQIPEAIGAIKDMVHNPKSRDRAKVVHAILENSGVLARPAQHIQHDINISITDMREKLKALLARPAAAALLPVAEKQETIDVEFTEESGDD